MDLPEEAEVHCTAWRKEGLHNSSPPSSMCDEVKESFLGSLGKALLLTFM